MKDHRKATVDAVPRSGQVLILRWQFPGRTPQRRVLLSATAAQRRYEMLIGNGAEASLYGAAIERWSEVA